MISKNQIKLIQQLKQKKHRAANNLFVAEGIKTITELLNSHIELEHLYTTKTFNITSNSETLITETELKKISFLNSPNQAVALFQTPKPKAIDTNDLIVALDNVRDPGNLGTIIRLCDWFGITNLVCNNETVDCYNPKVIQATMGSISRVNITYLDLAEFLKETTTTVYGTFLNGENIYSTALSKKGIVVLGNEANGISKEIEELTNSRITIPQFGTTKNTESLNVATATAILLSEFKRSTGM